MIFFSSVLIKIFIYLLCTFRGHLPSLSILDETATSNTGRSAESGCFDVTSWCFFFFFFFFFFFSFLLEIFQVTVHHKHVKENIAPRLGSW